MTPVTHSLTSFEKIYDTPHHTAPFDRIRTEEYEPAMREGMRQHEEEIQQIIHNPEAPNFENTIVALERSGELLDRVTDVFFNLLEAESNDEMQELAQKLSPVLSEHANRITLNEALFARVKAVYEAEHGVRSGEELRLLESTYDSFVRSGANLNEAQKQRYRELSKELSQLTVQFGQNHLKETNSYLKVITDEAVLEGMPESALTAAKETAKEKGVEGWAFPHLLRRPQLAQGALFGLPDAMLARE
jgi:peptidyl-dipeptidase Dcp